MSAKPTFVMGRVVLGDHGQPQVVPLTHKTEVLAYQENIKRLIEAARAYRRWKSAESLTELLNAASEIE